MSVPDTATFAALGTTAVVVTSPPEALTPARSVVDDAVAAIDLACSRFRPDAELVAVNRASGRWVEVSPLLLEAVQVSLRAAAQTNGAVDPTVGRAIRLLGYDRDFAELARTGPPLQATLEPVPGWRHVEVDAGRSRLRLGAGVQLDLGATAKALAADRASLRASDCTGAGVLVGLGGDLATAGPPPPGGWAVRVTDDHRAPEEASGQEIRLGGGGLATSSTQVRAWQRGSERIHHVVDPATGRPADGPWRTVSVAAATCVDANTAATAAIVRGRPAPAWLHHLGLPARLVRTDGSVHHVGGWPAETPPPAS